MKSLLDPVDRTINPDQPLLQGLTNAGPANLGTPMPLPEPVIPARQSNLDVFSNTPKGLQAYDEEEDGLFPDTDPMHFDDDDIFESSAFLGIAIGKKAKARKAARKAAKKAADAAELASIGADSPWNQPNEVAPTNYDPLTMQLNLQAQAQAAQAAQAAQIQAPLLQTVNNAQMATPALYSQVAPQPNYGNGYDNSLGLNAGFMPTASPVAPQKNNTMLYVGIGLALLVGGYLIIKNKK